METECKPLAGGESLEGGNGGGSVGGGGGIVPGAGRLSGGSGASWPSKKTILQPLDQSRPSGRAWQKYICPSYEIDHKVLHALTDPHLLRCI